MPSSEGASRTGSPALITEALARLSRAAQRTLMYPESHPAIPQAVSLFLEALARALEDHPLLTVNVAHDRLSVDDEAIEGRGAGLAWLAQRLFDKGVASLTMSERLDREATLALLRWLREPGGEAATEAPRLTGIILTYFDYASLRFSEKRAQGEAEDEAQRFWNAFLPGLTAEWYVGEAPPAEPAALARAVTGSVDRAEGVGGAAVASRLFAVGAELKHLPPGVRQAVKRRLAGFVAGLGDDLRAQVLQVDAEASVEKLDFLTELCDSLPDTAVLEILARLDRSGGRMSTSLVTLQNKLIGLSPRSDLLRGGVETRLEGLGLPRGLASLDPVKVRDILGEVLESRATATWTPGAYQGLLEDLSRKPPESGGSLNYPRDRFGDPASQEEVRAHLAEVAVSLLLALPEAPEAPDYLRLIAADADPALSTGRFAQIETTLTRLRELLVLKSYLPPDVVALAEAYVQSFSLDPRLEALLSAAAAEPQPPGLAGLFRAAGIEAACAALTRIASLAAGPEQERLIELVVSVDPEVFKAAVARIRSGGGAPIRALFLVFQHPKAPGGVEFAATFVGNRDPAVRLAAYRVLLEAEKRTGAIDRYLERALADPDAAVCALAIEKAGQLPPASALALLSRFLHGSLGEPSPRAAAAAAAVLARLDTPDARSAMGALLRSRRLRLRPHEVRVSDAVARALNSVGDSESRSAARVFRRSPAGWMAWLLGPTRPGAAP